MESQSSIELNSSNPENQIESSSPLLSCIKSFQIIFGDKLKLSELQSALINPENAANLINKLLTSFDIDNQLLAYQFAFELSENTSQKYRSVILQIIGQENPNLTNILKRKVFLEHSLNFLCRKQKTDPELIADLFQNLDTHKELILSAVLIVYFFMYARTGDVNLW